MNTSDAPPHIVLVNALGQQTLVLNRLVSALSSRFSVTAFTADLGWPYPEQISRLRTLVAAAPSPVHLVGWCTGPKMMMRVAAAAPEAVGSLTFLNPSWKTPTRPSSADTAYESELEAVFTAVLARQQMASRLAIVLAAQRSSESAAHIGLPPELADSAAAVMTDPQRLVAYAMRHREFWDDDPLANPRIGTFRHPIEIIHGLLDTVVAPGDVTALTAALPHATVTSEQMGHFGLHTHAAQVARHISAQIDAWSRCTAGAA